MLETFLHSGNIFVNIGQSDISFIIRNFRSSEKEKLMAPSEHSAESLNLDQGTSRKS